MKLVYMVEIETDPAGGLYHVDISGPDDVFPYMSAIMIIAEDSLDRLAKHDCRCDVCLERKAKAMVCHSILTSLDIAIMRPDSAVKH